MLFSDDEIIIKNPTIVNKAGEIFDKPLGRKEVRFAPYLAAYKSIIPKAKNRIPMVLEIFIKTLYVKFCYKIK